MIYTVTFSPAIDLIIQSDINIGETNEVYGTGYYMGGKGILASVVAQELGAQTMATGFLGGFTGSFIQEQLNETGIPSHFIHIDGINRINVKIISPQDGETEFNRNDFRVDQKSFQNLLKFLEDSLREEDYLAVAGAGVQGIEIEEYQKLFQLAVDKKARLVIGCPEQITRISFAYHPFLVKPDVHELNGVMPYTRQGSQEEKLSACALKIHQLGARNVLISDGQVGSVLVDETGTVYYGDPMEGEVVNTNGCGSAMIGAFLAAYEKTENIRESYRWAIAAGTATSFTTGLATKNMIEDLIDSVVINQ